MFIEEVIIEGFKSYATRTVIGKWDPRFNAITGLNGSGKSNILDSICFVLGITNLSHVRATNLNDLVYKKGQAGITKASVTIIFNNKDKAKSPQKYVDHDTITVTRQIVVGGKNKYIVNGRNESQQDVANMFQSIQLNVNNPNFLIMQGKITQVLNMKPTQILGMIQEAAGTRLYEDRKEKALKAMEKKDMKLQHSSSLIDNEITPKLEELREKKRDLLEYQKLKSEKEQLEKVLVAHSYCKLETGLANAEEKQQFNVDRMKHLEKMQRMLKEEIKENEERINEVTTERAKNGGAFFEIEEELKELGKEVTRIKTLCSLKESAEKDETEQMKELENNLKEADQSLDDTQKRLVLLKNNCQETIQKHEVTQKEVKDTENLLQTLTTGLASTEGQENGYLDQLSHAKQEASNASSEIQQLKMKLSHLQKEIKTEEPKAKTAKKENQALVRELESAKNVLDMVTGELESYQFDSSKEQMLLDQKVAIERKLEALNQEIQKIEREIPGLDFVYSDPYPGFDRSKVKGLIANLVKIPKEHANKANAIEVCAGNRLYQVVVESHEIGSQILQKGKLRKRVTIIPLNKVSSFRVRAEKIVAAQKLAPGKVDLALSLVGFDDELEHAMNFVFGTTLICSTPEVAKLVTFDKNVMLRSVTYDGDVYDPSGQLSGGSRTQSTGTLLKIQSLKEFQEEKSILEGQHHKLVMELEDLKSKKQLWAAMKQKKQLKEHEYELLQKRLSNNPHFKIIQHVEGLIAQHSEAKKALELTQERLQDSEKKIVEIEKEMNELSSNREGKLKSLQDQIKKGKKELAKLQPTVEKMQEEIMLIEAECSQIQTERGKTVQSIKQLQEQMNGTKADDTSLKKELYGLEAKQQQLNIKLKEEKKSLTKYDKELQQCEQMIQQKTQQIEDCKLEKQQIEIETNSMTQTRDSYKKQLVQLEKQHTWIQDQQQLFGKEGTIYDFSQVDLKEGEKRLNDISKRCDSLGRTVDRSVLEKFDRVEKKETQLRQKLNTVKKDKTMIGNTLEYLDRKKLDQLQKTFEKVNQDFGLIFGDLLHGNTCKLEPVDGDISQGIEIKVCLGGVWKQSLTELSGGQRSLIALSLILALLQFNPAPMYILDEVDAALDLSHTQNIGHLLRNRFKTSQFILVSLKDGMYQNANVLFRTKFVDGVSQVERRENKNLKPATIPSGVAGQTKRAVAAH